MKRTHLILILGAAVLVGAVAATAAPAAAQTGGEPASFYGTVEDGAGDPAPEGTTIVAVVDGEVRGELDVGEDGTLGGPDLTDDKIAVDSDAGDEVAFHITDPDGPQAEETAALDGGITEVELTFPDGFSFEPAVDITAPDAVETGDAVEIDVTAENVGAVTGQDDFTVVVDDETEIDETVELDSGAGDTRTIEITAPDDEATIDVAVTYGDASVTATIDVEAEVEDDDGNGDGDTGGAGGGGGGGVPAAPDPDPEPDEPETGPDVIEDPDEIADRVDLPAGVTASYAETVELTADADADRSQATFTETSPVASVTVAGTVTGDVTATRLDDEPNATAALNGDAVSVSQITVPDDAADRAATLRLRVSQDRLDEFDTTAEELTIVRHDAAADSWEPLGTAVVSDADADPVVVQAQTPGFSVFAVAVLEDVDGDEASDAADTSEDPGDDADGETDDAAAVDDESDDAAAVDDESDDSIPGFGVVTALVALMTIMLSIKFAPR